MSRIGKKEIVIPSGVTVSMKGDQEIEIKGLKGTLTRKLTPFVQVLVSEKDIKVSLKEGISKKKSCFHGLERALIANMVEGVSKGFSKTLELVGVGYKIVKKGNKLELNVGLSHLVQFEIPSDVSIEVPTPTSCVISGIDKQQVGHVASVIRAYRPIEPYKGKGFRYSDEVWRKKAGKSA